MKYTCNFIVLVCTVHRYPSTKALAQKSRCFRFKSTSRYKNMCVVFLLYSLWGSSFWNVPLTFNAMHGVGFIFYLFIYFSPPVVMHVGLLCIAFFLFVYAYVFEDLWTEVVLYKYQTIRHLPARMVCYHWCKPIKYWKKLEDLEIVLTTAHPGLSEINAPVGSKEVMSLGRGFPLKTMAGCRFGPTFTSSWVQVGSSLYTAAQHHGGTDQWPSRSFWWFPPGYITTCIQPDFHQKGVVGMKNTMYSFQLNRFAYTCLPCMLMELLHVIGLFLATCLSSVESVYRNAIIL